MRRVILILTTACAFLLAAPGSARADHMPVNAGAPIGFPIDVPSFVSGDWRFIHNFPAGPGLEGPLGVDWEPFTRDGRHYVAASSMTTGLTIFDVTDPVNPVRVSDYFSASCPQGGALYAAETLPEQRFFPGDFAFAPASGWENDMSITPDGRIGVIGTDAPGRCHDPAGGGIELVDLSDLTHPRTLHLVRTVGMAHSVTIDDGHPWIAYLSTSDNEDYVDIVDFKSCLGGVAKIDDCRPSVARATFNDAWTRGSALGSQSSYGCHDIRVRGNRLYCAAINSSMILDASGVLNANGGLNGQNIAAPGSTNACPLTDADPITAPGVKVTDCSLWDKNYFKAAGADAVQLRLVGMVRHGGRGTTKAPNQDVQISHQAEAIDHGRIMIVTDERGGGLNVGGADGYDGDFPACPGGGLWFYDITDETHPVLMTQPDGSPAVFLTKNIIQTNGNCTIHYGSQFADEHVLVFAWYTQGTHVMRFTPDYSKHQVSFEEVGTYIPAGASTWTAMGLTRNPSDPSELIIFTTDIVRGFDVLAMKLPRETAHTSKKAHVLGSRQRRAPCRTPASRTDRVCSCLPLRRRQQPASSVVKGLPGALRHSPVALRRC